MNAIKVLTVFTYICFNWPEDSQAMLKVSETNSSYDAFVNLLRGRDGLPGRDGMAGPPGPPGMQGERGPAGPKSGGATYTRWGNHNCPNITGTDEVYSGITAGSHYTHPGSGANYLCMPEVSQYTLTYSVDGPPAKTYIYGAEYEFPLQGQHDHNVPCAVCRVSTRAAVLMIPARTTCPSSWTREYYGYLMAEYYNHKRSGMYECVDQAMESLTGGAPNTNGALFYHVEADCGTGIPCPPYITYKEVNCVVCSK